MAETKKQEVSNAGEQQAALVVNNAFIEGLTAQLTQKTKYGLTFPKDYNYANELMGAYLTLQSTVDKDKKCVLQSCSQQSIAKTLMDMVTMGLSMQKKQCYPVAYGGELQCQVSVYGNTTIARRYGLKNISAMVIYEGDVFNYEIKDAEITITEHKQDFLNINGKKIIGAYAIATLEDGTKHTELMSFDMIKQAWKQGFGYRENGEGTHQKFSDQMAMKTVKNRCLKYIIRTFGTQAISDILDEQDDREGDDRVAMDVQHDIETSANSIPFEEDITVVPEEVKEEELPAFMQQESAE